MTLKVISSHRERATRQIPKSVGEVRIHTVDQRLICDFAGLPERNLSQQKVADQVRREVLLEHAKIDGVAERFPHLLTAAQQHPMRENCSRQGDTSSHQERGPVNRVHSENVLSNQMQ